LVHGVEAGNPHRAPTLHSSHKHFLAGLDLIWYLDFRHRFFSVAIGL